MIKRDPTFTCHSDSCLTGSGGWSTDLKFIWYICWSNKVYTRTKKFIQNNNDDQLISINVLEFVGVIMNYCAALVAIAMDNFDLDPWPVLLAMCDNTSAVNWVTHACMKSRIGRALGRFFCALLINSRLGINSRWLSTYENFIADEISRLKKEMLESNPTNPHPIVDYKCLLQEHSVLRTCRRFVPSEELISMLDSLLLTGNCPSLEKIRTLKQQGLGKLISLDG